MDYFFGAFVFFGVYVVLAELLEERKNRRLRMKTREFLKDRRVHEQGTADFFERSEPIS